MTPTHTPLGPDPKSDQTFLLATLLTQSRRTGRVSTRLSANSHHWIGKNPPSDRQSAHQKFWRRYDTSPIADPMFRGAAWCPIGHSATRRRRPVCPDKNNQARVSSRPMSETPCASRAADWAQSLANDNFLHRRTSRFRSRLLRFEMFPNYCGARHRDGKEQNGRHFFVPEFGRNKKNQSAKLQGRPRWNLTLIGRDRARATLMQTVCNQTASAL